MLRMLWSKLVSLFRRGDALEALDYYRPAERLLFRYFDGSRDRVVDPLPLYRRLKDVWPALSVDIRGARAEGSKFQEIAYRGMITKTYQLFEVQPLTDVGDGSTTGLGETEVLDLLDRFLAYTGGVKKNWSPCPTSAAETSGSSPSSSDASPPTPSSSASGSTAAEPSSATPSPLPTEPALPLEHCRPEVIISTPPPTEPTSPPSSAASTRPPAPPEPSTGGG